MDPALSTPTLHTWSWIALVVYVAAMVLFGWIGRRRVRDADDFATARGAYGAVFLGLAFAATTASGGTFLGFPALAHDAGLAALWSAVLYPAGVFVGVLLCMRLVTAAGERYGNRSIPEYLGDRYGSEGVRVLVSLASLLLLFYLAGQLLSGLVMFQVLLGLGPGAAVAITAAVLLAYVTLGGSHADILTDGIQGALMLLIAGLVVTLFLTGAGVPGGHTGVVDRLRALDPHLVGWVNPDHPLYRSPWTLFAFFLAHVPMGLLPHIGNKLWALRRGSQRLGFALLVLVFSLLLGLLGFGGIHARALLGDRLTELGASNAALPAMLLELLPAWLVAWVGVGILAAIMSTADGLLVSSSQVLANDLYRRSWAPRFEAGRGAEEIDRRVLWLSRVGIALSLVVAAVIAWLSMSRNIALLMWAGVGGLMAAFAGPLVLGALWRGVTRAGAYAGLVSGLAAFLLLHSGILPSDAAGALGWLAAQAPNPMACAALGEIVSVAVTWLVSMLTPGLPEEHLAELFGEDR